MADIELVIKIPKKVYKSICNMENPICRTTLMVSIANGKPLNQVLDEIKTEIDSAIPICDYEEDYLYANGLEKAIEIIEKRKDEKNADSN